VIKSAVIWICLAVAALCVALAASGFFIAAFYLWLAPHLGAASAAAVSGAVLLVFAAVIAVVLRRLRWRRLSLMTEVGSLIGVGFQLLKMVVQRDPKRALIVSLVAGALAEYISAPNNKR
jgi:hypothetical protein